MDVLTRPQTKAPERIETPRLVLRKPRLDDAEAIYANYASSPDVTRFLGWPRHESVESTRSFLEFAEAEWGEWPAGPYVIEVREGGTIVGGTGFGFETPHRAATGYVLAQGVWGRGYATEALRAVVGVALTLDLVRLYALCHTEHAASWRVLEKCGFGREGVLRRHAQFPNLGVAEPLDVFCYSLVLR
jgi:[ribosomal protein S5]-alanine N-acetyltransferase